MQGILETFWQIIIALFGALAIGGLVVGTVILGVGCALFAFVWVCLRRKR